MPGDVLMYPSSSNQSMLLGIDPGHTPVISLRKNAAVIGGSLTTDDQLICARVHTTGISLYNSAMGAPSAMHVVAPMFMTPSVSMGGLHGSDMAPIDGGLVVLDLALESDAVVHLSSGTAPLSVILRYQGSDELPESLAGTSGKLRFVERSATGRIVSLDPRMTTLTHPLTSIPPGPSVTEVMFTLVAPASLVVYRSVVLSPSTATATIATDAPTFRNLVANGNMRLNSKSISLPDSPWSLGMPVGYGIGNNGATTLDAWRVIRDTTTLNSGRFTVDQVSVSDLPGIDAAIGLVNTSQGTKPATQGLSQNVKALNTILAWGTSSGKTLSLSFWVQGSVIGPMGVLVTNGTGNTFGALFWITEQNKWEHKSVSIPAPPVGSSWTTSGLHLTFTFTDKGSVGAGGDAMTGWNTFANAWGVLGQSDMTLVDASRILFTGVQLEAASEATAFETRPTAIERTLVDWDAVIAGEMTVAADLACGSNATFSNALRVLNGGDSSTIGMAVEGSIEATGDLFAYSDQALKTQLERVSGALDKIQDLQGYTYTLVNELGSSRRHMGLLAQDLQAVAPEVVMPGSDGHLTVAYGNLAALFVEAIKELGTRDKM